MYTGSCHCGNVSFQAEGELKEAIECNCSHCSRKGYLLWFIARDKFHLKSSEEQHATYVFNRHVIDHHFCRNCGCAPFATGTGPAGDAVAAVNVRCLEGIDLAAVKRKPFDGLHKS